MNILKNGIEYKIADSSIYDSKNDWLDPCPLCGKQILKNQPTQYLTSHDSKDNRLINFINAHHFCIKPGSDYRNPHCIVTSGTRENFFKNLLSQIED